MKFKDIFSIFLSGVKIRRKTWPDDIYWLYDTEKCIVYQITKNAKTECFMLHVMSEITYNDWEMIEECNEYKCTIENIIDYMSGVKPIKRVAWYNNPTKLLIPIQSWEDMEEYIDTFDKDEVQSMNIYCYDNNLYVGCKLTDEDLNATDWCMFEME